MTESRSRLERLLKLERHLRSVSIRLSLAASAVLGVLAACDAAGAAPASGFIAPPSSPRASYHQTEPVLKEPLGRAAAGRNAAVLPSLKFRVPNQGAYAGAKALANQAKSGRRQGVAAVAGSLNGPQVQGAALEPETEFPAMTLDEQVAYLGSDQAVEPPDTQVAAGPASLVEVLNSSLSVWAKTGGLIALADLNSFFGVPSGYRFSDPRVVFDAASARWFISGFSLDNGSDSQTYLAVSATSDPTGSWTTYRIAVNTSGVIYDQPKLGVSDDKVAISWADYSNGGTVFTGEETWILQKSDLVAGGTVHVGAFSPDPSRFGIVPAMSLSSTPTEFLTYNRETSIGVVAITGTPVQANVSWAESSLPIVTTTAPPDAQQPSGTVATNDDRFLSAVWSGGTLWVSGNDGCVPPGDTSTRSCLRLISVETGAPTLGIDTDLSTLGIDLYFPAVTLDSAGDPYLVATESSAALYPSVLAEASRNGAASFSGVTVARGNGPYGGSRWGDYSGASVDPSDANDVWLAGEYTPSSAGGLHWGTSLARLTLTPPTVSAVSPTLGPGSGGTAVTVTGEEFVAGATSVKFGNAASPGVTVQSPNELIASSPPGTGTVDVTVATINGTSGTSGSDRFTYTQPNPYHPLTPYRIVDTRTGSGEPYSGQTLGPGSTLATQVTGVPGPQGQTVPTGATAVVLNVTAVAPSSGTYVTVWPSGQPLPLASNLNVAAGGVVPNLVEVALGEGGRVSLYNALGNTDVVVDVEGYVGPAGDTSGLFNPLAPARITDTRPDSGEPNAGKTMGPGSTLSVQVTGEGNVPSTGVSAVVLNVTAVYPSSGSFLTVWSRRCATPPRLQSQPAGATKRAESRDRSGGDGRAGGHLQRTRLPRRGGGRGRLVHGLDDLDRLQVLRRGRSAAHRRHTIGLGS